MDVQNTENETTNTITNSGHSDKYRQSKENMVGGVSDSSWRTVSRSARLSRTEPIFQDYIFDLVRVLLQSINNQVNMYLKAKGRDQISK